MALTACDDLGAVCDTAGSADECEGDQVCTFTGEIEYDDTSRPVNLCLRTCENATDCGDGEVCAIVLCTDRAANIRTCQTGPAAEPLATNPCGG